MKQEPVQIVDECNQPIAVVPRARMRAEGLRHRASYIFVFDHDGRLFLQKRSAAKDMHPGWYDACAGGVMRPGESYADNARREIGEELGVHDAALESYGEFAFDDGSLRVFGALFSLTSSGPFEFSDDEVASGEFVAVHDVLGRRFQPITPDSYAALELLLARRAQKPARRASSARVSASPARPAEER